jgi:hypothetical protein
MPVIEREIETAALMLGSDRSRGYCLEMICADFLAGANLDQGDPEMLLFSMTRFFKFLPEEQRQAFRECWEKHREFDWPKTLALTLGPCVLREFAAAGSMS